MSAAFFIEPFALQKGFDYWKYLETQSHFREQTQSIDQSLSRHLFSADAIRDGKVNSAVALSSELSSLSGTIADGLRSVEHALSESQKSIVLALNDISFAIQSGFSEIAYTLENIECILERIEHAVKSPEQTWANEQFSIANDLFSKGFRHEALRHVDRAINGHGDRSGYPYDHRFYFLSGIISLGGCHPDHRELLNLKKAQQAFEMAVKFAVSANPKDAAPFNAARIRAMKLLAWALYCDDQSHKSEIVYRQLTENVQATGIDWYYLSKVLFHQKKSDEGRIAFSKALILSPNIAACAIIDKDFLPFKSIIEQEIISLKKTYVEAAQKEYKSIAAYTSPNFRSILSRYTNGYFDEVANELTLAISKFSAENIDICPLSKIPGKFALVREKSRSVDAIVHNVRHSLQETIKSPSPKLDTHGLPVPKKSPFDAPINVLKADFNALNGDNHRTSATVDGDSYVRKKSLMDIFKSMRIK